MWQCKLYNLVANFRTNASDVTWSPRNQNMQCEWNTKLILRNTGNLKLRNTRASQSRLSVRESRLCWLCPDLCVFPKRLDVFMHTFDPKVRYMITIIIVAQNYPIHHQAGILSESIMFCWHLRHGHCTRYGAQVVVLFASSAFLKMSLRSTIFRGDFFGPFTWCSRALRFAHLSCTSIGPSVIAL